MTEEKQRSSTRLADTRWRTTVGKLYVVLRNIVPAPTKTARSYTKVKVCHLFNTYSVYAGLVTCVYIYIYIFTL